MSVSCVKCGKAVDEYWVGTTRMEMKTDGRVDCVWLFCQPCGESVNDELLANAKARKDEEVG